MSYEQRKLTIAELFYMLNDAEDGEIIDHAISELSNRGVNIDRDVYFSWDAV